MKREGDRDRERQRQRQRQRERGASEGLGADSAVQPIIMYRAHAHENKSIQSCPRARLSDLICTTQNENETKALTTKGRFIFSTSEGVCADSSPSSQAVVFPFEYQFFYLFTAELSTSTLLELPNMNHMKDPKTVF